MKETSNGRYREQAGRHYCLVAKSYLTRVKGVDTNQRIKNSEITKQRNKKNGEFHNG